MERYSRQREQPAQRCRGMVCVTCTLRKLPFVWTQGINCYLLFSVDFPVWFHPTPIKHTSTQFSKHEWLLSVPYKHSCSPTPVCSSKSWPAYTSQGCHHSFRSLPCGLHSLTKVAWILPSHSWLVQNRVESSLSSSSRPSSHHTSSLGCPSSCSHMPWNRSTIPGALSLCFWKQFSWNSELSIWFLEGGFPDELLIPFLISLRFPWGLSDVVLFLQEMEFLPVWSRGDGHCE